MVIFDIVLLILLAIIGGFYVRIEYKKYIREINELKTAKQRAINDLDKYTKQVDKDAVIQVGKDILQRQKKSQLDQALDDIVSKDNPDLN